MAQAVPLFLLAGGEIVLALIGLRIAAWVARGWREWRALERGGEDGGEPPTPGPRGGLRLVPGGRAASEPGALRAAA